MFLINFPGFQLASEMLNRLNRYTLVILIWYQKSQCGKLKTISPTLKFGSLLQLGNGSWRREGRRELLEAMGLVLYLDKM